MTTADQRRRIHDLDATLQVGKRGLDPAVDELTEQLESADLVKVRFLRAARGGTTTDALAADLADRTNADLVETRGHTAVYRR